MPRGAICLTFFQYTIRQGICELSAQFFAKEGCLLVSKLFNNNALLWTKLLLIISTQFIRIARNKLFQMGICLSLERERVNSKWKIFQKLGKLIKMEIGWTVCWFSYVLFFTSCVAPLRSCQTQKEEKITCRRFFNNETSMRHCLKLLGIQVHRIFLKNSVCQVIIMVVTSISEIFACNM